MSQSPPSRLIQSESNAVHPDSQDGAISALPPPPRRLPPDQVYRHASPTPVPARAVTGFDSLQALCPPPPRQKTPLRAVTAGYPSSRPFPAAEKNTDDILEENQRRKGPKKHGKDQNRLLAR